MSTVIDSLILEFGLDPSKFNKGQKDIIDKVDKLSETAVRGSKNIEGATKKSSDAFASLGRQALALFTFFAAGRGIKEMVQFITATDVASSRLSKNLNVGIGQLSGWFGASEKAGGSAQGTADSFRQFSDQIQNLKATGEAGIIPFLRALEEGGKRQIDLNKPLTETYVDIAAALQKLGETDRTQAIWLGKQILGDEALVTLMLEKGAAIRETIDAQQKLVGVTKEDTEAAEKLNEAWKGAELSAISLGRAILTKLSPALQKVLGEFRYMFNNAAKGQIPETSFVGTLLKKLGYGNLTVPGEKSDATSAPGSGAFKSQDEKEAFIRSEAKKRGIDPDVAMAVAKSEGFNSFVGDQGTSFGAFQLHYKNNIPGLSNSGLGDSFTAKTGKHASDPASERDGIQFALDQAKIGGWTPWHGAANTGIGRWAGIGSGGGSSRAETHIGQVNVYTQAKDAEGIAKDIKPAIERNSLAAQANYGQQ